VIDFGVLFSQLLASYWWLPPLFVLAALFKFAWFKPKKGSVPFKFFKFVNFYILARAY